MKRLIVVLILVFFLMPGFVLAQSFPQEGPDTCIDCIEPGGIVPCGRKCDNPMTDKNECLPCTLCDFFIMFDLLIDMSVKALTPIIVLLIIAIMALTVYLRSKSAPEKINKVKKALIGVVIGMAIIFAAWVIINSVLVALGAAKWDNVNNLWIINCSPPEIEEVELVKTYCGDGNIQRPNNDEFIEICDGEDHGGKTCQSLGYESGDLTCLDDCSGFNESECVDYPPPAPLVLPTLVPMHPEPLGPPPTGERFISIEFRPLSLYRYDACFKTAEVWHWVYRDGRDWDRETIWVFQDDRGIDAVRISGPERLKTVECLNGYVLIQPTNLGTCEEGVVLFTRLSETSAIYQCTDYDGHNDSRWYYICQEAD